MTIHKKGQAHWEGDIKRGKGKQYPPRVVC